MRLHEQARRHLIRCSAAATHAASRTTRANLDPGNTTIVFTLAADAHHRSLPASVRDRRPGHSGDLEISMPIDFDQLDVLQYFPRVPSRHVSIR